MSLSSIKPNIREANPANEYIILVALSKPRNCPKNPTTAPYTAKVIIKPNPNSIDIKSPFLAPATIARGTIINTNGNVQGSTMFDIPPKKDNSIVAVASGVVLRYINPNKTIENSTKADTTRTTLNFFSDLVILIE